MSLQFDYKQEAEIVLNQKRTESLGFCPIIKASCRTDCICFSEGRIYENKAKKTWTVYFPSCGNVLNSGEIGVWN